MALHCFGILSLVELLFASLVFKEHRCPPDLLHKATTVRSVLTRYAFLPGCFRSRHITSLANKFTCLRQGPIGKDVGSSNKLRVMVLMIAVRIFIADLP